MERYDFIIVGAGLYGSTFARLATDRGSKCLVVDKRPNVGGNLYCEKIEDINVHKYGAHIFHTSDDEVWNFVNRIVKFNRYTNSPIAKAPDGKTYNLPFNMNTFYQMWKTETPKEAMRILQTQREQTARHLKKQGVDAPRNLEEQALILIGKDIYELLIKGYTEKQWGRPCDQLPPEIIKRLPVRLIFDNNYFNDSYQGIPIGGYNKLIDGLLSGIEVKINTDFLIPSNRSVLTECAKKIVYTGPIDAFFDFQLGKLEWRTVKFDVEVIDTPNYQGNAVVNYTSTSIPWTRIIEHKHFESFGDAVYENNKTVISKEYSSEWKPGMEPYYPVNDSRNTLIYERYRDLSRNHPNVIFGGRLAEYRYYDMAPIVRQVMNKIDEIFDRFD